MARFEANRSRDTLKTYWTDLVKIDAEKISDDLYQRGVLPEEKFDEVIAAKANDQKSRILLKYLQCCSEDGVAEFAVLLTKPENSEFSWLGQAILRDLGADIDEDRIDFCARLLRVKALSRRDVHYLRSIRDDEERASVLFRDFLPRCSPKQLLEVEGFLNEGSSGEREGGPTSRHAQAQPDQWMNGDDPPPVRQRTRRVSKEDSLRRSACMPTPVQVDFALRQPLSRQDSVSKLPHEAVTALKHRLEIDDCHYWRNLASHFNIDLSSQQYILNDCERKKLCPSNRLIHELDAKGKEIEDLINALKRVHKGAAEELLTILEPVLPRKRIETDPIPDTREDVFVSPRSQSQPASIQKRADQGQSSRYVPSRGQTNRPSPLYYDTGGQMPAAVDGSRQSRGILHSDHHPTASGSSNGNPQLPRQLYTDDTTPRGSEAYRASKHFQY
eukprot:m.310006 g.310006  ORF g.310006 m.310006 type:complete len:444 (+) comp49081_c0_seq1:107-1438(+)